ncbi:SIMPL domain-containing protein [Draconibacterium sp. IB214405]|uniref:SIMPL domain-containing protein n=1 Tax=Draconibacterium sp. IB214405 TaxID=3097352 RepID=UPI002A109052|nr:SIMPL domain-containing protein [Draconibacterium sp. IB214405]MDX8340310.1 SIMPL domain-containing protein [Draconibacterium sp. IB214405]
MKKIILAFALIVAMLGSFAQDNKSGTIKVEGKSEVKLLPEEIWFNVSMTVKDQDYKTCADLAVQKLAEIKSLFTENGIEKDKIKTNSYSVREIQRHDPELRKMVSDGYQATIPLTVRTNRDYDKNNVIFELIKDNLESNFNMNFALSEKQIAEVKTKLIKLAVADAKEKAEIISDAAGVELGKIANIQYGEPNIVGINNPPALRKADIMIRDYASQNEIIDILEPDEVKMGTNIVISWNVQ